MTKPKLTYRVLVDTSVRVSIDPDAPEFEEWVQFLTGDVVHEDEVPDHADIKGWVKSGHWKPTKEPVDGD